ncbi:MAG: hypothetical protein Q8R15_04470 [Candidatus Micrarchaeota archaeon]|nr:hypothetical protein [Candidatus Micrarchaeota archaeon]
MRVAPGSIARWQPLPAELYRGSRPPVGSGSRSVIAAIKRHRGVPSKYTIGATLHLLEDYRDFLFSKPTVAAELRKKQRVELKKLTLEEICTPKMWRIISHLPEALGHRRKLLAQRVAAFNGKPTVSELIRYVHGKRVKSSSTPLRVDPVLRLVVDRKMIQLLGAMSGDEIRRLRLDRKPPHGKVARFVKEKLRREEMEE